MVFQDPIASLNPRFTVRQAVREPLDIFEPKRPTRERDRLADAMLDRVGLGAAYAERYPHELSGGQNQRVSIARALVADPKLVICDEAVSALDVSIQAQILNLIADIQRDTGIALLFVSHDLVGGAPPQPAPAGAVPRPRDGVRRRGDAVRAPAPSLHAFAARRRAGAGSGRRARARVPRPCPATCRARSRRPLAACSAARCPRASPVCAITAPPLRGVPEARFACHHPLEEDLP